MALRQTGLTIAPLHNSSWKSGIPSSSDAFPPPGFMAARKGIGWKCIMACSTNNQGIKK